MQRLAEQVDAVPACGRFIDHALLNFLYACPGRGKWTGVTDVFTTIAEACEAFVRDTLALVYAVWAGMAEPAMEHIPAMQSCATRQHTIPVIWIQTLLSSIAIDQRE